MGRCISVYIATLQYACGLMVFKRPSEPLDGLWISSVLVLISAFLALSMLPLYPKKFRPLDPLSDFIVQYFIACFIIEYFMADFWFPWEALMMGFCPVISGKMEEIFIQLNIDTSILITAQEYVTCGELQPAFSLLSGIMILLITLHATKVINFSLICSNGFVFFLNDAFERLKVATQKFIPKSFDTSRSNKSSRHSSDCMDMEHNEFEGVPMPNAHYGLDSDLDEPGDGITTEYHIFRNR